MGHRYIKRFSVTSLMGLVVYLMIGLFTPTLGFSNPSDSCLAGSTLMSDGKSMYFRLFVPRNFKTDKKYPLVMCLHGIGECGTDNRAQIDRENMSHQWMLDSVKTKYMAFVLYPQCPSSSYEWGYFNTGTAQQKGYAGLPSVAAVKVIDSLIKVYPIDTTRLYVGGLSWGGLGTEAIMMSYPNKFAAAFPCAGENKLNTVSVMTKTPFWIFHGGSDGTVPVTLDRALATAVEQASIPLVRFVSGTDMSNPTGISIDSLDKAVAKGALYLYAEITGGDHGSGWHEAFFCTQLVPWLMSKSKENGQKTFTWPAPGPASTTAIAERKISTSEHAGVLQVAHGMISWNGLSLPTTLSIFSVNGTLLRHFDISAAKGDMALNGLPSGIYVAMVGTEQFSAANGNTFVISDK